MKKKYLIHDYLNKFPLDNPYNNIQKGNYPKLEQMIITSNLNNKSLFTNASHLGGENLYKNNSLSIELLKLFILFSRIFGQNPKILKAHKSIANWNVRKNMNTGIFLSLRSNSKTYENYINKFLLFFLPLLNQKDSFFIINSNNKNYYNKSENSSTGSLIFGLSSLNIFNPIFPDIEYYQYSNFINEIKNSSEFIGCRINFQCRFPENVETQKRKLFPYLSKKIVYGKLENNKNYNFICNLNNSIFKRDFILSYYQFPAPIFKK